MRYRPGVTRTLGKGAFGLLSSLWKEMAPRIFGAARRMPFAAFLATKIFNSLSRAYLRFRPGDVSNVRVRRNGVIFSLNLDEDIQRRIYFGLFDIPDLRLVETILRPADVAVDVGAQIGFYTLHFARLVGRDGHVVSFEPDIRNFARLQENTLANAFQDRATLLNTAVSDVPGPRDLFLASPAHSAWNSIEYFSDIATNAVAVECTTLDEALRTRGAIRLLKIDVEGHEEAVLDGATGLLEKRRIDYIFLESNTRRLREIGKSFEDIEHLLTKYGYTRLSPAHLPPHDNTFNCLFASPTAFPAKPAVSVRRRQKDL